MAIHYLLVLNRQGKSRLTKWFNNRYSVQDRTRILVEVHRLIGLRDSRQQSNFVEFELVKLVYRRYAGLYFILAIDVLDSELSYLESLHFFVEILDAYFDNVCELNLVFNFQKVYGALDEVYAGGEVLELLRQKILHRLEYLDRLE